MDKLQISYFADNIDEDRDKQIEEAMESIGYKRWASGYDLIKAKRDLCFERPK